MDALNWRRYCTAYEMKSNSLSSALAEAARKIAASYVDPASLIAYTECHLIPLDETKGSGQ